MSLETKGLFSMADYTSLLKRLELEGNENIRSFHIGTSYTFEEGLPFFMNIILDSNYNFRIVLI